MEEDGGGRIGVNLGTPEATDVGGMITPELEIEIVSGEEVEEEET